MPIGLGSPYRAPCPGTWPNPIPITLGPQNQHCNPGDNGKPIWQNLTTLFDGSAPTGNDSGPPVLHACAGGQTLIGDNCYKIQSPAAYKDFSLCHKFGFKNLAAAHFFPGRLGFTDSGHDSCTAGVYTSTPDTTRYRTKTMSGTYTKTVAGPGGPPTASETQVRAYTVGALTGLVTETANTDTGGFATSTTYDLLQEALQMDYQCGVWQNVPVSDWNTLLASPGDYTTGGGTTPVLGYESTTSISLPNVISFTIKFHSASGMWTSTDTWTGTITLSDAYTSGNWNADTDALFGYWDLSDDAVYPWRQGGNYNLAPLLSYDEVANLDVNQFSYTGTTFADTTPGRFGSTPTGGVIGAPLPAGYDKFFDKNAITYALVSGVMTLISYGEYAPDWCPRATQWMNLNQGQWTSAGAWAMCNYQPDGFTGNPFGGKYVKCVWAETILFAKPSHNYARPCGSVDAAYLDQTTTTCSGGHLVGSARFSSVPGTCPTPTTSGYQWNDTGVKGDFIFKDWGYNFRDIAITPGLRPDTFALTSFVATQSCIGHTPCCPAVAYIAPGSITYGFSNSVKYTMPSLTLDEVLSSLWQGRVEQWMTDPLWQVPSSACTAQTLDDGTATVGTYFPPYEEARTGPPSGAPAYPSGCGVNYSGYIAARNTGGAIIAECEPPDYNACDYPRWLTWANQITGCTWDIPPEECAAYTP